MTWRRIRTRGREGIGCSPVPRSPKTNRDATAERGKEHEEAGEEGNVSGHECRYVYWRQHLRYCTPPHQWSRQHGSRQLPPLPHQTASGPSSGRPPDPTEPNRHALQANRHSGRDGREEAPETGTTNHQHHHHHHHHHHPLQASQRCGDASHLRLRVTTGLPGSHNCNAARSRAEWH